MTELPDLRVSDGDRERVAGELSAHYAEGRLDDAELDERLEMTYSARTRSDLLALTADLPELSVGDLQVRSEFNARRNQLERRLLQEAGGGLVPFGICTVVWAASGGGAFWPMWVLLVVLIPLVRNGWALRGPAPDVVQVEAYLDRKERHRVRHADRHARAVERRARRKTGA